MWQGRELVACTLAFLAGNVLGDFLSFPPWVYLLLSCAFAFCSLRRPGWAVLLLCFVFLGAGAVQLGRMPRPQGPSALVQWAALQKETFSAWLGQLAPQGEELAILRALAIGDKGDLTRDLRMVYRESGAMHLLALSGLHVGLIYALLAWLLRPLGGHRTALLFRSGLILVFLWTYALITGLSASISRAVLMITFYELSLLNIFRPEALRDIGFQLSYTAVLSILLLHPRLSRLLQTRSPLLTRIWELLSVSLCCQATCGVLAWLYFGTFPRYFLLTTLLSIPLATAVMYAIAASVASASLSSLAAHLLSTAHLPASSSSHLPSDWLLSALSTLSDVTTDILHWLLHLLNTLIRLIAEL